MIRHTADAALERASRRLEKQRKIYIEFSEPGQPDWRQHKHKAEAFRESVAIVNEVRAAIAKATGQEPAP